MLVSPFVHLTRSWGAQIYPWHLPLGDTQVAIAWTAQFKPNRPNWFPWFSRLRSSQKQTAPLRGLVRKLHGKKETDSPTSLGGCPWLAFHPCSLARVLGAGASLTADSWNKSGKTSSASNAMAPWQRIRHVFHLTFSRSMWQSWLHGKSSK